MGIMFHHFHGGTHPEVQGSISAEDLRGLIDFVGRSRIISAREFLEKASASTLQPDDVCLTFDDNLKCQYDIALPVLKDMGLTAFWFVYTSPLVGIPERIEIYRHFRCTEFDSVESFYESFFEYAFRSPIGTRLKRALAGFHPESHLTDFPFYTAEDRRFRYVRDCVLGHEEYCSLMDDLIGETLNNEAFLDRLWMNSDDILDLHSSGHVIGLHSHSHPTTLGDLNAELQEKEYRDNAQVIAHITGEAPTVVSHPCNSYDANTLEVLRRMGVTLGFRANLKEIPNRTRLEFPREDHSNIIKAMRI